MTVLRSIHGQTWVFPLLSIVLPNHPPWWWRRRRTEASGNGDDVQPHVLSAHPGKLTQILIVSDGKSAADHAVDFSTTVSLAVQRARGACNGCVRSLAPGSQREGATI